MNKFLEDVLANLTANIFASIVGFLVLALGSVLLVGWRRQRHDIWLGVCLSDVKDFENTFSRIAAGFFKQQFGTWGRGIVPASSVRPVEHEQGLVNPESWRLLIGKAITSLEHAEGSVVRGQQSRVHLVLGTPSLFSLALGIRLKNRHGLVLYHFQQYEKSSQVYHRIWQMDRTAKNLRSPVAGKQFQYDFFSELPIEKPLEVLPEGMPEHECLVFELGANEISVAVRKFREKRLRFSSLRIFRRLRDLDPKNPRDWIQAAAEMAHSIYSVKNGSPKESFIFLDGPAVIALMAGDALGDYLPRKINLMQFYNSTYVNVLSLPDSGLSKI